MPKLLSLGAALAMAALTAACAASTGPSASAASGDVNGRVSTIRSLVVSNPAVYSSNVFRAQSTRAAAEEEQGFSGGTVPGAPISIFTGTETFPPGAIGPMAPGSGASGSMAGYAGQ